MFKPKNVSEIENVIAEIKANYYQIHISFDLEELNDLSSDSKKKLIVALKVNQSNKNTIIKQINKFHDIFFAFLIDNSEGQGKELNYDLLHNILSKIFDAKIILAGGIKLENLKTIGLMLNPYGIDVSSSLELERGIKDPYKIKEFLKEVKSLKELECER